MTKTNGTDQAAHNQMVASAIVKALTEQRDSALNVAARTKAEWEVAMTKLQEALKQIEELEAKLAETLKLPLDAKEAEVLPS